MILSVGRGGGTNEGEVRLAATLKRDFGQDSIQLLLSPLSSVQENRERNFSPEHRDIATVQTAQPLLYQSP